MDAIKIGQLEIRANCDLVAVLHREPIMHPQTHTFTGSFKSNPHWTQLTPANARRLAQALLDVAAFLEHCDAAKSGAA